MLCLVVVAVVAMGAAAPAAPAPQDLEEQVQDIAAHLRCPVCQNLSVGDSPSGLANEMRGVIREKLKAGESRQQIEAYFTSKYGEWILLAPTKKGFNLLAWGLPFVGIVAGAFAVVFLTRRWAERQAAAGAGEGAPPADPADAQYRERVRRELDEFAR
jgi:cytochrome c-type biogenesis protein CcmH